MVNVMKILLKDGVKYVPYTYKNEKELESMFFEHYKDIFGEDTVLFQGSKIKTLSNIGTIPDAFIIDVKNKIWFVVEVELKDHDTDSVITVILFLLVLYYILSRLCKKIVYIYSLNIRYSLKLLP